jgi:hypothetical protein
MLMLLSVALIAFFLVSGIFLTIEARRRNRNFAMMPVRQSEATTESGTAAKPELPKAA